MQFDLGNSPISHPSSFRDPAGNIYRIGNAIYRTVASYGIADYKKLTGSGLAAELHERGLLVRHNEHAPDAIPHPDGSVECVLEPETIAHLSWPWEWSFTQFKDAALAVLEIQRSALARGMRLKDASAFNIQFHRGAPVWIDTLSFEDNSDGQPWVAYRQFCRHFLAPLALMAHVDPLLGRWMLLHLDGIPLGLASRTLPLRTRWNTGLAAHIHLQARMQARHASRALVEGGATPTLSPAGQAAVLDSLQRAVEGLRWNPEGTEWSDYYDHTNYSDESFDRKEGEIQRMLREIEPRGRVWDFGANDARFSELVAREVSSVVAWDVDPGAVERAWLRLRGRSESGVLPLLLDLTNPSPAAGWDFQERGSLLDRGPVDLVVALALIHHICLTGEIPLERFLAFLARCAPTALVEWVPRDDSQAKRLLARRPDRCPDYNDCAFEDAVGKHWRVREVVELKPSLRRLYRLERRD